MNTKKSRKLEDKIKFLTDYPYSRNKIDKRKRRALKRAHRRIIKKAGAKEIKDQLE